MYMNLDDIEAIDFTVGGQAGRIVRSNALKGGVRMDIDVPGLAPSGAAAITSITIGAFTGTVIGRRAFNGGSRFTVDVPNVGTVARGSAGVKTGTNTVGTFIPEGWGRNWFRALAEARNGGKAQMAWVGSSETQGYWSSNMQTKSAFALVRAALHAEIGDGGSGYQGMVFSDTFLSGAPTGAYEHYQNVGNAWIETPNAGSISTPTFAFGPSVGSLNIAGGATVDITFSGTELHLWFFNAHESSPFTYEVDDADPVTVTPGAGMGSDLAMIRYPAASGLSTGTHTVRITGGTTAVRLAGIDAENATGVVANNYSRAGMASVAYSNTDGFESGTYMGGHRFRNTYGQDAADRSADLVILTVPPNDAILAEEGTEAQAFVKNWEQYLAGVLDNVYGGGDVVEGQTDILIVDPMMKITSDTVRPVWREIQAHARALATVYGAAYVNVGAALNQSWSRFYNLGYMGNEDDPTTSGDDDIHPSDAGHAFIAQQVLNVILPS